MYFDLHMAHYYDVISHVEYMLHQTQPIATNNVVVDNVVSQKSRRIFRNVLSP
ncbi:hypothetical protein J4421_00925 [Candidatus Woesearchaeota archaeon]|nr:hypothetical protein [Candidatus Woesearchaeota archaeon]